MNATTAGASRPDVALADDGRFAVAWNGEGVGDLHGVFVQRFDAGGRLRGRRDADEQHDGPIARATEPRLRRGRRTDRCLERPGARGPIGDLLASKRSQWCIRPGNASEWQRRGAQQNAAIAAMGDGSFFVTWASALGDRAGGAVWDIVSRQIDVLGQPLSGARVINTTSRGLRGSASVGSNRAGQVVVAWGGHGQGEGAGIYAQRFGSVAVTDHEAPVIHVSLLNDTGLSASDGLTTDPSATGQVSDASLVVSVRAGFDAVPRGFYQEIVGSLGSGGSFALTRDKLEAIAGGPLSDGAHVLHLQATDSHGLESARVDLPFVLDTQAPRISAELDHDTVASDSDSITSDPTIAGLVVDRSRVTRLAAAFDAASAFVDIADLLQADGRFTIARARLEAMAGKSLPTGQHVFQIAATDEHDHTTTTSVGFNLQPDGLFVTSLDLATSSDSAPLGDRSTSAGRVVLVGVTQPLAALLLAETGATALANNEGRFQFPGLSLAVGANTFTVSATNAASETVSQFVSIERTDQAAAVDPVLEWNQAALEAVRQDASAPTVASRAIAMVQVAIYDAVAAIDHSQAFLVALPAPTGASLEAAVTGAGRARSRLPVPGAASRVCNDAHGCFGTGAGRASKERRHGVRASRCRCGDCDSFTGRVGRIRADIQRRRGGRVAIHAADVRPVSDAPVGHARAVFDELAG